MNELANTVYRAVPRVNVVFSPGPNAFGILPPATAPKTVANPLERAPVKVPVAAPDSGIVFY